MAKKSPSKKRVQVKKKTAKPTVERPGFTARAGEVVQTILGTMAGVVEGIGILVTGTEKEKQEKAAAAKKAAAKAGRTAKKAAAKATKVVKKAASVKTTPAKKVSAKKVVKETAVKISTQVVAPKKVARKARKKAEG